MFDRGIKFRDRPLRPNESSNYYCDICGQDIHPDLIHSHKCPPEFTLAYQRRSELETKRI